MVLVLSACLWFWHGAILRGMASVLVADQGQQDAKFVLVVDGDRRYDAAAALYREDPSRRVVLIEPYPTRLVQVGALPSFEAISRRELHARGVPEEAVTVIPGKARTAWEETRLLRSWLKEHPDAQLLLLCDRFGSSYRRHVLDSTLPAGEAARVRILALPDRRYDETNWWKSRRGAKEWLVGLTTLVYASCRGEGRLCCEQWNPDDYENDLQRAVGRR
jgi:hypothetical protein